MDDLEAKGLIAAGTRRNLLRNSLVLIAPRDSQLKDFAGLTASSVRLIALGDPASVPAGQYGRQTLLSLHLWDQVAAKLESKLKQCVETDLAAARREAGRYGAVAAGPGRGRRVVGRHR